jgi:hypothetical protein
MKLLRAILSKMDIPLPVVFVTDQEFALTNAIDVVFQGDGHSIYRILCGWHVDHCVLGHAKKRFRVGLNSGDPKSKEKLEAFMKSWRGLLLSPTKDEYRDRYDAFKKS